MERLKPIVWTGSAARIIDQTQLPTELVYENVVTVEAMVDAIKRLKVRGAPCIGVCAAFGLYLAMKEFPDSGSHIEFKVFVEKNADFLAQSRPTAVNLFWALDRCKNVIFSRMPAPVVELKQVLLTEARLMLDEDNRDCHAIGEYGYELIKDCRAILTHCNAGGLATSEFGTALAPIYVAQEKGKIIRVFADETRPLLQGARLTTYELHAAGLPVTLICDNMAASVMRAGSVDAVIVGADRIVANGDFANKVGTYGVALLAKAHNIPFYVAAPLSTFDFEMKTGKEIPIEERDAEEITCGFGKRTAPEGIDVYNPAFDMTPGELVTAFITEKGIVKAPYVKSIAQLDSEK
jgi:methylthioribose-1-phosphate isomerase